jgi:hypothetical protein
LDDLEIDLAWLLMLAEQKTPGDPQVTDGGALLAAVARHRVKDGEASLRDIEQELRRWSL